MVILIVGPSGVGKTSTYQSAKSTFPDVIFDHLDGIAAQWGFKNGLINEPRITLLNETIADADLFLDIGLFAVGKLAGEHQNQHLVVDVGAGFQLAQTAKQLHRVFNVIAIKASPEVAYRRIKAARNDERTFDQYRQQEYDTNRVAVYDSAQHSIETSMQSEQETCSQFVDVLRGILEA